MRALITSRKPMDVKIINYLNMVSSGYSAKMNEDVEHMAEENGRQ